MISLEKLKPDDIRNNKLSIDDRAFHDWYRFVLSFPAHLVRYYLKRFNADSSMTLLDPFCGTGTTIVEAKKNQIKSYGIEATPMAAFASSVKSNWINKSDKLIHHLNKTLEIAELEFNKNELITLTSEENQILIRNSISPLPLSKCLILKSVIDKIPDLDVKKLFLLGLAHISVHNASNLRFGPEVGVSRKKKEDCNVFKNFHTKINSMIIDLESVANGKHAFSKTIQLDSREINGEIPYNSIDIVITSPPYPNEKDYTRTTRLESVLLGFIKNKKDLRMLKEGLIRSNTRNVYAKDTEDNYIADHQSIVGIAEEIERRRKDLRKNSGFERLYHRVAKLYFGGMKNHLNNLKLYLKDGARLAYVVGDQASYLQVLIRTGELLAEIADKLGYKVINLDLFRTRFSTATGNNLREEVLILEWNKKRSRIMPKKKNRYDQLIEKVFFKHYRKGATEVEFNRNDFNSIAKELQIKLPKNLGDIIYSYRYRNRLPVKIDRLLKKGEEWVIRSTGRGKYKFTKSSFGKVEPNPRLSKIKVLDSTPEIIRRYALNDEQALLGIIRYNRLIDIFLEITCYPLQSHLRTTVKGMGQVETDELYIGVNKSGAQYVVPIQAKGKKDTLGVVQIEQDFAICEEKFKGLVSRPIAAQFIEDNLIALFEFEKNEGQIRIKEEKHYRIVPNNDLSDDEILSYSF